MIKKGDVVKISYTGKFEDGSVFDSSQGREPLEFEAGAGRVIKGLDKEIIGMKKGDKKTITIPPEEAYGPVNSQLLVEVPRENFPKNLNIQKDTKLYLRGPNDVPMIATVVEVKEAGVVLNLNHPLAGKTLVFDIEIVDIAKKE